MKLISEQSRHWSVCRALQTTKAFACNKQIQTGNSSTVKVCPGQWKHQCKKRSALWLQEHFRITWTEDQNWSTQEIQATDLKYHCSYHWLYYKNIHRSQQNDFWYNFSTLIFTNNKTFSFASATKTTLNLYWETVRTSELPLILPMNISL